MAGSASSISGGTPGGTWHDPSAAEEREQSSWASFGTYTLSWQHAPWPTGSNDTATGDGCNYSKGPPTNTWNWRDKRRGGKGTKGAQAEKQPDDYVSFEPHLVYRIVLPLSPAAMGTGWWKKEVANALDFGVKVSWRSMRRIPDNEETEKSLYVWAPGFP